METKRGFNVDMKLIRYGLLSGFIIVFVIVWKLNIIEEGVSNLEEIKKELDIHSAELQLCQQHLFRLGNWANKKSDLPTIYAITPTYYRLVQKAELTRISQTLALVPNVHWVVIEDSEEKTDLVSHLLADSSLNYTHLNAKTPPFEQLKNKDPRWKKHRGVEQRNMALKWLRETLRRNVDSGVVYFMDDDNTYSIKLFNEISKVKKVGVWPVGLVGGLNAETPILDASGKVVAYRSGWKSDRPFAIDMAGFAINLDLILANSHANFSYKMEKGLQESEFLGYFVKKEDLEPLADNCSKVYVWHTRTETPVVKGFIDGLEV